MYGARVALRLLTSAQKIDAPKKVKKLTSAEARKAKKCVHQHDRISLTARRDRMARRKRGEEVLCVCAGAALALTASARTRSCEQRRSPHAIDSTRLVPPSSVPSRLPPVLSFRSPLSVLCIPTSRLFRQPPCITVFSHRSGYPKYRPAARSLLSRASCRVKMSSLFALALHARMRSLAIDFGCWLVGCSERAIVGYARYVQGRRHDCVTSGPAGVSRARSVGTPTSGSIGSGGHPTGCGLPCSSAATRRLPAI